SLPLRVVLRFPKTVVDPVSIAFGNARVGTSAIDTLTISNVGTAELVVSDVNVSTAAFSVPDTAASVPIGGNLKLPVTFSPAETSDYSDTLRVHTNTDDAP